MESKDTPTVNGEIEDMSSRLKKHRRLRNLSQEELAELSGLSIRTIQRLEKGESVGSAYTLRTLAAALQLTPDELIGLTPQHTIPHDTTLSYRLLLTWSALAGIVLPLANIFLPAILLWRRRQDPQIEEWGKKIVSFQIIWTLITLGMMLVIPLLLAVIVVGMPFHLVAVPVYFVCMGVNSFFLFRVAFHLPNHTPFLDRLPNFL